MNDYLSLDNGTLITDLDAAETGCANQVYLRTTSSAFHTEKAELREQIFQELYDARARISHLEKKEARLLRTLKSLKDVKERLEVTLRSISEGVIAADMRGRVYFLNAAAERLTGLTLETAAGKLFSSVIQITHEVTGNRDLGSLIDAALNTGKIIELSSASTLVSSDGRNWIVSISVSPLKDNKGDLSGVAIVLRDITEKITLQNELFKVQKLESLGLLAGGIAHDFNNLLTAILGNISLARCLITEDSPAWPRLDQAEKASNHAREMVRQLLTFSRGGKPVKQIVAPQDLIREAASFAIHGSNATCTFSLSEDLWPLEADPTQLKQIINNLVINAVQAMPEGGSIRIGAENTVLSADAAIPLAAGPYIRITVEDSGIGIPEEIRMKIFDPYFSTKPYGNGLGLSTSYSIIRNHAGHITLESTPGKGTKFIIYLPASTLEIEIAANEESLAWRGSGKVLVMDDDELIRNVASAMLLHLGYQPFCCRNGEEAIAVYRDALKTGEPFQSVILDLTIPGGMGGKETIRHLIEIDPNVRALVSSGYSQCDTIADYIQHGFRGVVAKPYNIRELQRALRELQ